MTTELETLQNIEYLLELLVSQDGRFKDKMDKDSKPELKAKIFKEEQVVIEK